MLAGRARGENSPRGPHSSVPATDSGLERVPRPRSYLSQKSPSGPLPPHSPAQPQAWRRPPTLSSVPPGGRQLYIPVSLPGAPLPGHGSAQDPGMGGGRVPNQEGSSSCPSSGGAALSPPPIAKFRPDGRPRPLSSFLSEAWCLCSNGKAGNFFDILDLVTWKLGGVRAIRNVTQEEVMKASPLASGPRVFSEPRLVNPTISRPSYF